MNGIEYTVMGLDKRLAVRKRCRIPEATLFLLALLGGSLGGTLGMLHFRHKTRHKRFSVGFPIILLLHAACLVFGIFHF